MNISRTMLQWIVARPEVMSRLKTAGQCALEIELLGGEPENRKATAIYRRKQKEALDAIIQIYCEWSKPDANNRGLDDTGGRSVGDSTGN